MMPPQPEGWGARGASTAPTSRPETTPVYDPPPVGYQPSVPPIYPSVPPYAPPRKRSPLGWILAFIGMGLFVLVVIAVMMVAKFGRNRLGAIEGAQTAQTIKQGEKLLDENNADLISTLGNETSFTKTFTIGDGAKISLRNTNGNIAVTAWDQPNAELVVIKRGGDRNAPVVFTANGGNLTVRPVQNRGNQELRFEVKVPRQLGRIELSSQNGVIKLSDVAGEILVDGTNGAIELANVVGVSKVHTINGSIKAALREASERGMEFESTNGSIEVTVPKGFEADLDASTIHGSVNIDDSFGVTVEKGIVGQKAKGEIGQGGERLRLATTNGNIKLTVAEPPATVREKRRGNGN